MARKTILLSNTPFFIPPHTRGDHEFKGHGPNILITTRLYIVELRKITAYTYARFTEDRSDWTTAEGGQSVHVFDGTFDQEIERINYIVSPGTSASWSMKQSGGHDGFTQGLTSGPVREYYIVGDTRGSEAGTKSGVETRFRQIEIDYEPRLDPPLGTTEIQPEPVEFIPPHTRGDRDFDGNGPKVTCFVRIAVRNQREIWATVFMDARETKHDWTTASGTADFLLHASDMPIRAILSDTVSVINYLDTDHEEDMFGQSAGELVRKFTFLGDTRGDEAGTKTRVNVDFNPIVFEKMA